MFCICLFNELLETRAENEEANNCRRHRILPLGNDPFHVRSNSFPLMEDAAFTCERRSRHAGRNGARKQTVTAVLVNWEKLGGSPVRLLQNLLGPL